MLGFDPLSTSPLSSFEAASVSTGPVSDTDIILRPIQSGTILCLWGLGEFDDCTPVTPPSSGGGSAGGLATWRGPSFPAQRFPWNPTKSLEPTSRRQEPVTARRDLAKLQLEDDLEVVRILATFLGHN